MLKRIDDQRAALDRGGQPAGLDRYRQAAVSLLTDAAGPQGVRRDARRPRRTWTATAATPSAGRC